MMNVTIIAVGSLKEKYLKDGCAEYIKRLKAYCKTEIIEVSEERCGDSPSDSEIKTVMNKEAQRIIQKIPKGSFVIPLCVEGIEFESPKLAELFEKISFSNSRLCFIIGGSFGLDRQVKDMGSIKLSFGKMTLPHQLARLVLLEQVYRAFSILSHSKYHK